MTNATDHEPSFQLSGGGLVYRIQQRILGTGAGDYPIRRQFLFSLVILWLPLAVLTWIEGRFFRSGAAQPFILDDIWTRRR